MPAKQLSHLRHRDQVPKPKVLNSNSFSRDVEISEEAWEEKKKKKPHRRKYKQARKVSSSHRKDLSYITFFNCD